LHFHGTSIGRAYVHLFFRRWRPASVIVASE
jgi:hypothetical protein